MPALQGFVKDLVGSADLPNSVAWTNAINATGRAVGPIFGGLVLETLGPAPGFLINAASFAFVVLMLSMLRSQELSPRTLAPSERGEIRQGLRYIRNDPVLAATCLIMLVVFIAAQNFQIALALVATDMLAASSQTYGTLMSTLGFGAATGSLILARQPRVGLPPILLHTAPLAIAARSRRRAHPAACTRCLFCLWPRLDGRDLPRLLTRVQMPQGISHRFAREVASRPRQAVGKNGAVHPGVSSGHSL
jgi:MFS family permease